MEGWEKECCTPQHVQFRTRNCQDLPWGCSSIKVNMQSRKAEQEDLVLVNLEWKRRKLFGDKQPLILLRTVGCCLRMKEELFFIFLCVFLYYAVSMCLVSIFLSPSVFTFWNLISYILNWHWNCFGIRISFNLCDLPTS